MKKRWQELTGAVRKLNRNMRRTRYGRKRGWFFFVMELIVTFEQPFVTGGEKDKGGGGRMGVS